MTSEPTFEAMPFEMPGETQPPLSAAGDLKSEEEGEYHGHWHGGPHFWRRHRHRRRRPYWPPSSFPFDPWAFDGDDSSGPPNSDGSSFEQEEEVTIRDHRHGSRALQERIYGPHLGKAPNVWLQRHWESSRAPYWRQHNFANVVGSPFHWTIKHRWPSGGIRDPYWWRQWNFKAMDWPRYARTRHWRPWDTGQEPYGSWTEPASGPPEPYSVGAGPGGTEYMRWVQGTLNDVLGLQLPTHGIADPATRSAIRSFQQQKGLPADGIVGPDTERALASARVDTAAPASAPMPTAPDIMASPAPGATPPMPHMTAAPEAAATSPTSPASVQAVPNQSHEFDFEWGHFQTETEDPRATGSLSALARLIPDDPDYRKYIPLNYRLDAKKLVADVAQDLNAKGKSAHFWLELAHWGLTAAEIFAEVSALATGLGAILATGANFLALGEPYMEQAEEIAANWSATGFSRGAVIGADGRPIKLLREYFGSDYFKNNDWFPPGRKIAMANYRVGLLVGYVQGRILRQTKNKLAIFWHDLGRRMGDQTYRGPKERWTAHDWRNWYIDSAAAFRRDHLSS